MTGESSESEEGEGESSYSDMSSATDSQQSPSPVQPGGGNPVQAYVRPEITYPPMPYQMPDHRQDQYQPLSDHRPEDELSSEGEGEEEESSGLDSSPTDTNPSPN